MQAIKTIRKHALSYIVFIVLLAVVFGVFLWQHGKVDNLNKQLTVVKGQANVLKSDNTNLKQQSSNLTGQLNKANQSISKLSQSNSFVPGAACQTPQLALSEEKNPGGAAGSAGEIFSYQNVSETPCTVDGYPGFLALDNKGYVMPNGSVQKGSGVPNTITLAPSAKAYFLAFWSAHDAVGNENGCIIPSLIESTPPGNLYPLVIATSDLSYICGNVSVGAFSSLSNLGY